MNTQDETEQGVEDVFDTSPNPPSIEPLAQVAANLIRSAYDQGYVLGFRAGKNAGLDLALEVINRPSKPFVPKHPEGKNPF